MEIFGKIAAGVLKGRCRVLKRDNFGRDFKTRILRSIEGINIIWRIYMRMGNTTRDGKATIKVYKMDFES